jgi:Protein of unknown function (DUF1320)
MAFITKSDFPANVHDDILEALTKGNDGVIATNADRTIDEMKAYLNSRYDVTAIFNAVGNARNKFMVRVATTITLYYIYLVHNPRKMHQTMVDEFERAIKTLEQIQKGIISPEGLPPITIDDGTNSGNGMPVQWGSIDNLKSDW